MTSTLSPDPVHHKTNLTKYSKDNMQINTFEHIIKTTYHQVITSTSMNKSSLQHKQSKTITHEPSLSKLVQ